MSSYVLLACLFGMLAMAYMVSGKDILSPFVITVVMFLISSIVAVVYMSKWRFSLSYWTVFFIVTALLTFGIGEILARWVCNITVEKKESKEEERIDIPIVLMVALIILMGILFGITMIKMYNLSVEVGNTQGLSGMMTYARRATLADGYSRTSSFNHILVFSRAAVYLVGWVLIHNYIYKKIKKKDFVLFIPIIFCFLIQAIGTMARGFFIEWIAFYLMLYLILSSKKKGWKNWNPLKIILLGAIALGAFLLVFVLLGLMANRFNLASITDTIAFYVGLSIPSLDKFLRLSDETSKIVGSETLYGIYAVLNKFGISNAGLVRHLDFVGFYEVEGNIYTSLRRYINDYGYFGTYFIQFYLGAFYGFFYNYIKKNTSEIMIILYAFFAYPLVMQGIDEILLSSYVSVSTIHLFMYMGITYFVLIKAKDIFKRHE